METGRWRDYVKRRPHVIVVGQLFVSFRPRIPGGRINFSIVADRTLNRVSASRADEFLWRYGNFAIVGRFVLRSRNRAKLFGAGDGNKANARHRSRAQLQPLRLNANSRSCHLFRLN